MNKCKNPECKKEISDNKKYCNEQCLKRHLEIKKIAFNNACPESSKELEKEKEPKIRNFDLELQLIEKSSSKFVEIIPNRSGSIIRGKVVSFDDRYGKIAIQCTENNRSCNVVIKFGYISAIRVYD